MLDRHIAIDLSRVSPESHGDAHDELPGGVDEIGTIPNPDGKPEPVRMVRRGSHEERWLFSRATVANVDRWYQQLEHRFVLERAPRWLLRSGPRGIPLWQWFAIVGLFAAGWIVGWIIGSGIVGALRLVARRSPLAWDNVLLERMRTPLVLALMLLLVAAVSPSLGLLRAAQEFVDDLRRGGLLAVLFLALARSVDVMAEVLTASPWAREHSASYSLIPLGARVAKLFVLALAAVALLSVLGYPVASLLAGLGIGGLAIALAAQKTVENLFGAFSIGADQPFRVGDFVKFEDVLGNVEAVGLRSTRIRTLDRTLITIPNGKLAEMRIESFAARDRLRFVSVVGLTYDTTAAQLQEVVAGFERVLREHPQVVPDSISVFFQAFGESSLRVEASAYFKTADFKNFQGYRQEVLLRFMAVVEQAGTSIATPLRTLQFAEPAPLASKPTS